MTVQLPRDACLAFWNASAWGKIKGRVKFIQSDLSKPGWSKKLKVLSMAAVSFVHNVREHAAICSVTAENFLTC